MNLYVYRLQHWRGRCACGKPARFRMHVYVHPAWRIADLVGYGHNCGRVRCLVKAVKPHNWAFDSVLRAGFYWQQLEMKRFRTALKRLWR